MICRLCLCELHQFVSVFNEFESHRESGIAKLVAKYFHIELQLDDAVSNKICNSCLKHLNDFHDFCLLIEQKQQTLLEELSNFKCDLSVDELAVFQPFERAKEDVKNVPLYEPPIDTIFPEKIEPETDLLETVNEKTTDAPSENSADEDFYLSNLDTSTECSDASDTKNLEKRPSKMRKQKLAKNSKGKFTKNSNSQRSNRKFQCKECNEILPNYRSLSNHMSRRHDLKEFLKFECNICEKKFSSKTVLNRHLLIHSDPDNLNTCELCQISFNTKQLYKAHKKTTHAEELKIVCDICGKRLKNKIGYEKHYKYVHTDPKDLQVQCEICHVWLKNCSSMESHMYNHLDESLGNEYKCNICGAVKTTKRKLKAHKYHHHPPKMLNCEICNKEFKRERPLKEHMAVHTGQPLYTCKFCPQTFKSNGNMHSHRRRLHPNELSSKSSQPHNI